MSELEQTAATRRRPTADPAEFTPAVIAFHVQRGRQLRAEAMARGFRAAWSAVRGTVGSGRGRRLGRLATRPAR